MNRFVGFKNLSAGVMYWFIIVALVVFVAWMILGVLGNCTNIGSDEVKLPDIDDAGYEFYIKANGRMIFTDEYMIISDGIYILNGYYELMDNKYKWHDSDLELDEYYFGEIQVTKR